MLSFLVSAVLWSTGPAFDQVGKGQNGYDDYLQAVKILRDPSATALMDWKPGQPIPSSLDRREGLTPLDVRRALLRRYRNVLELVKQGNGKVFRDPDQGQEPSRRMSQLYDVVRIGLFAEMASFVQSADGETDRATATLLDQFEFFDRVNRSGWAGILLGDIMLGITMRSFQSLISQMPLPDLLQVQASAQSLLDRPLAVLEAFNPDSFQFAYDLILNSKSGEFHPLFGYGSDMGYDPDLEPLNDQFRALTPELKKALVSSVMRRMNDEYRRACLIFEGPERDWTLHFPSRGRDEINKDSLISSTASLLTYFAMPLCVRIEVERRTKMRLLTEYAKAAEYRWHHGSWPERTTDLDPLTGQPYLYEQRQDGTIRIASAGTKETGEISLWDSPSDRPSDPEPDGPSDPHADSRNYLPSRSQ